MDPQKTAATIVLAQHPDGAIPHYPGGPLDPWNHVEAAMGLDTVGRHDEAEAALKWLAQQQNPDGSWYSEYVDARPTNTTRDSNLCAYIAVGCYHHFLTTQNMDFLARLWPTVDRAIQFVLTLQQPSGEVRWRLETDGTMTDEALVAGCSSVHHALRCALAIANRLDRKRPSWAPSAARLRAAIAGRPELFVAKPHAMDWYYPVLCGVFNGPDADRRISNGWRRFVVPEQGVRCVDHEPWVTVAETAETALTLATNNNHAAARALLDAINHLETTDGDYWTGYNYRTLTIWPPERTTWTASAVLLAHAALNENPATVASFRPKQIQQ